MKDTVIFPENCAKYGVLNFASKKEELPEASDTFRAVGYGHSASLWKSVLQAYMDVDYQGILSIENEDPSLPAKLVSREQPIFLKIFAKRFWMNRIHTMVATISCSALFVISCSFASALSRRVHASRDALRIFAAGAVLPAFSPEYLRSFVRLSLRRVRAPHAHPALE